MLTDFLFLDEIAERIQKQKIPRLLYQKGICLEGEFQPYMNLGEYTSANFLTDIERETPVTVRVSKVFSPPGSGDTTRDAVGFFVRFFTEEGHFDLLTHTLSIPKEIRTPEHMIRLIDTFRNNAGSREREENALFTLAAERPEFLSFLIHYFSDDATVKSYRFIEGIPLNDHLLRAPDGTEREASFFLRPPDGKKSITRQEAEFFAGYDPDTAARDMADALLAGKFPVYDLEVRFRNGESLIAGRVTIREFAERCTSEQIGYTPQNLVPGIELFPNEWNRFTAFAFNESVRIRGGSR